MNYESGVPMAVTDNYSPIGTGSRVFITSYEGWRAPIKGEKFDPNVDVWLDINQFNQGISTDTLNNVWGNATRNNPKLRSPWSLSESLARGPKHTVQGAREVGPQDGSVQRAESGALGRPPRQCFGRELWKGHDTREYAPENATGATINLLTAAAATSPENAW